MKITKYEHSCLAIEEKGKYLVIDPGFLTKSPPDLKNVVALVITHIHPDHFDPANIQKIVDLNPDVNIFTTKDVAEQLKLPGVEIPQTGKNYIIEAFELEFFGGTHALISPDFPLAQNFGVLVNQKLYDPGDSFTECPKSYDILALPVMAPWLKFSESLAVLTSTPATTLLPVHNGFINREGKLVYERWFRPACEKLGKSYHELTPGESITV